MKHSTRSRMSLAIALLIGIASHALAASASAQVARTHKKDGKVIVALGDRVFTIYHYKGFAKPILYPVMGPDQVRMTRDYPQKNDTAGEAKDHPHHRSIWFTHGNVNGENFWHEAKEQARIVTVGEPEAMTNDRGQAVIKAKHNWVGKDGKKIVCTDTTTIICGTFDNGDRFIDYTKVIHASQGDVTFADDKEGTMGIRTHPNLRVKPVKKGGPSGHAVNSAGDKDKSIWGKKAAWVSYWGKINDKTYGVAIFDHPANLRHPTTWHARDYGLVAANPFGLSFFQKKPKGSGAHTIKKGQSQSFHYLIVFHRGDVKEGKVADRFKAWSGK